MFVIRNEVRLPVPIARTWRLLTDFDRYAEWHPLVSLRPDPEDEWKLHYTHRRKGWDRLSTDAEIVRRAPQEALAWRFGFPLVGSLEEVFEIEKDEKGTRLVHCFRCSGLISFVVIGRMRRGLRNILVATDASLGKYLARDRQTQTPFARLTTKGAK